MDALTTYRRRLGQACRHNELPWRYLLNAAPSLAYATAGRRLSDTAAGVLSALNRDGVATTSIGAIGSDASLFSELAATVQELERAKAGELDEARRAANDTSAIGSKTFNVELLGGRPVLDTSDVFCRFAVDRPILDLANAYFGMFTRLRYVNVWHTLATRVGPRESQLWHRDREDFLIMKVFVYLADVGEDAGPFTYAPGTHPKGHVTAEPAYALEGGVKRTTDAQMAAVVPPEQWIQAMGPRGTIVFTDTRGYHKGGLARGSDRLMYTCMFTSRVSQSRELLDRRAAVTPPPEDRAVAFAVK
jgi:hypothetical protein